MSKFEQSPKHNPTPDNTRAVNPGQGESSHRQKRPRAPQFGSDRRDQRGADARHHGDASSRTNSGGGSGPSERRKVTQDRRQSWR